MKSSTLRYGALWLTVATIFGCMRTDANGAAEQAQATPAPADPVATATDTAPAPSPQEAPPATEETPADPMPAATDGQDAPPPAPAPPADGADVVVSASNDANQAALAASAEAAMEAPSAAPGDPEHLDRASAQVRVIDRSVDRVAMAQRQTPSRAAAATQLTTPVAHMTPQAKAAAVARFNHLATRFQTPSLLTEPPPPTQLYSLKSGNVGISNLDTSASVHFAMKSPLSDWRDESLVAKDTREFVCGMPDCLFWMQTGGKPAVYYKISSPQRYTIAWSPGKGVWDLRLSPQGD